MSTRGALAQLASVAEKARSNPFIYYTAAAAMMVSLMYIAFYLRMIPWSNYTAVYEQAVRLGIDETVAKYSYIHANDPWIEYWLAKYLHEHGIGSWKTLTRDNPATHIFWYPWGRDFTRSEYPLLPMLGSLGDPLFTTMKLPVLSGVIMVAAAFILLLYEYGLAAAVAGTLPLAVIYASASRTFAGFAEKEGFSMPLFATSLLLLSIALSRRSRTAAAASGIAAGLIAMSWGGYAVMSLVYAATALLLPLAIRSREAENWLRCILVASLTYTVLAVVLSSIGYGKVSIIFVAIAPLTTILVILATRLIYGDLAERIAALGLTPVKAYTVFLAAAVVAGLAASPLLGLRGRQFFTLLWPLRSLGLVEFPRIQETVAEMTGITRPGVARQLMNDVNILIILVPVLGLYGLYRVIKGREARLLPLVVTGLGLFYGVMGMVYLEQTMAVAGSLMVGAVLGAMMKHGEESVPARRRRRHSETSIDEIKKAIAVFMLVAILVGSAVAASYTIDHLKRRVASITGFSVNAVDYAWLDLLQSLRNMNNTVVVSWWDYGYWISVGSGKPSLADGATLNTTQIELLAKFFTGTEDEADSILRQLHLEPNKTLIVIHDLAVFDLNKGVFRYLGSIDIPKSWAMHHIAARDDNFNRLVEAVRRGAAQEVINIVNNTMIYRMFAAAPYYLNKVGEVAPPSLAQVVRINGSTVNVVNMFGFAMPRFSFKHFEPYMIIVAPFMNIKGTVLMTQPGVYQFHVIVVYKWTG